MSKKEPTLQEGEMMMRDYMDMTYDWDKEREVLETMKQCQRNYHYKKWNDMAPNLKKHIISQLLYVATNSPSKQYESHYDVYWTADRKVIDEISKYTWGNTHRRKPPSTWRNTQANASMYILWVAKEPSTNLNCNADGTLKENSHHERWFNSYCSIGISVGLTMRTAVKMGFVTGANKSHNDLNGNAFWEKRLGILDDVKEDKKRITYGLGIGFPQEGRPRYESDDTELMIGASNGSKITTTEQETHPITGMKMRKAKIVDIKGKENTIVKDPYGVEHMLPEKPTFKINTSLHSLRNIKAIEIK
jgi:hypothetical protein